MRHIPNPDNVTALTVSIDGGTPRTFRGRFAWTLGHLTRAGSKGVSTIDRPAPRWSHYVLILRREGVKIETQRENHGGIYAGRHGRYILQSKVDVLDVAETRAA